MRVIFLDFDGVLNADTAEADESAELLTARWLDTAMVARLTRLVESTAALIVISSSWRQRRSQEELRAILAEHGYVGGILDVTPRHQRPPEGERLVRASEISAGLAAHPEVTSFVYPRGRRRLRTACFTTRSNGLPSRAHRRRHPSRAFAARRIRSVTRSRSLAVLLRGEPTTCARRTRPIIESRGACNASTYVGVSRCFRRPPVTQPNPRGFPFRREKASKLDATGFMP